MKQAPKFGKKQLGVAIAATLAIGFGFSAGAYAAGMPGAGTVTVGKVTASSGTNGATGGSTGSVIAGLTSGDTLTVTKSSVVQWGGYNPNVLSPDISLLKGDKNPAGFNIGAGNTLYVKGSTANIALLNVDASGNPSIIAGKLLSSPTDPVNIFIANANGITVTSTGVIAAPVVGLLGASNLAAAPGTNGLPAANAAQNAFASNTMPVTFGNNGNILVQGTIENVPIATPANAATPANPATRVIIAGSGSVNVNYDHIVTNSSEIYGGTALSSVSTTGAGNLSLGSATTQVTGYAPTTVTLNDANPTKVFANGDLNFTGLSSILPSNSNGTANYGWTGTLSNTGILSLSDNFIGGLKSTLVSTSNPWFNTKGAVAGTFINTPVGSVNNTGTINPSGTNLGIYANGIVNTGILNVQPGGALTLNSGSGPINLGGTVQANNATPAIGSATLKTTSSGDINVTAPLTIQGSSPAAGTFTVNAQGDVNLGGVLSLTDTTGNAAGSADYSINGNSITITANQTVMDSNGTTSLQPTATLNVNQQGQTVTIGNGATLTAGDVLIGLKSGGSSNNRVLVANRVNLVANGNITATNITNSGRYTSGNISIYGTNVSGDGLGTMTGQVFDFDVTGNVRKSQANLTNNYWTNGLVLTSAGANPTLNLYPNGSGRQFINLRVAGNITANASAAKPPVFNAPSLTGTKGATAQNSNALSQMMLMATGNLTIGGGEGAATLDSAGAQSGYFYFPGLSYFGTIPSLSNPNAIGTGSITALGSVNNSLAMPVAGGQGLYFMTNNLTVGGSLYTNMNSWVNYGQSATQYNNVTYAVRWSPSDISNTLNMTPATKIANVYTIPSN